ncbi:MAG: hypothetical protein R3E39_28655 [Anaerolineae bacterium]
MSADDPERRYQDILRRIEQHKQQQASAPKQSVLAAVLDSLNAAGLLSAIKRRPPAGLSAYGPKSFTGLVATLESLLAVDEQDSLGPFHWTGVVLWHKPKGYHHYQTMGLLGIWARETQSGIAVLVGEKALTFNAPVFNPESYYHHIKRRFDLFYEGDASPPDAAHTLLDVRYDPADRLAQREALEATLRRWVSAHHTPSAE